MSKLTFLGTGAADWDIVQDKELPGYRSFSSLLLDDSIIIDCGIGTMQYAERFGGMAVYDNVDTVLFTHSHNDHFRPKAIIALCDHVDHEITVYGDAVFSELLPAHEHLRFVPIAPGTSFSVHGYEITSLWANHLTSYLEEFPRHYYIQKPGEKALFIGYDGGWLCAPTWQFLTKHPIDVYVIDATCGDTCTYNFRNFSHNNTAMIDFLWQTCRENHVIGEHSQLIFTHLAKTLHPSHEEVSSVAKKKGYLVAFDGMTYTY